LTPFNDFANLFLSFGTFKHHIPFYIIVGGSKSLWWCIVGGLEHPSRFRVPLGPRRL